VLQEPGVSCEGIDVANGNIFVGLHQNGLGVYRRDAASGTVARIGTATELTNAWGVFARDNTVFVTDALGGLVTVDATDAAQPRVLGRVDTGGEARGVVVDGNIAYVAAGSVGLVVVDVSDLSAPRVIGSADMPGSALRVAFAAGRVSDEKQPPRSAASVTMRMRDFDCPPPRAQSRVIRLRMVVGSRAMM
jgi:hypothetical protein